jgi:N-glycosylase/DNA lyase
MLGKKTLTPIVYSAVGDVFRSRFGCKAGWAHSVLFAAELPEFRHKLPTELREEMQLFSAQKRAKASASRENTPVKVERSPSTHKTSKKRIKVELVTPNTSLLLLP